MSAPKKNKTFRVTNEELKEINEKIKSIIESNDQLETSSDVLLNWARDEKLIDSLDDQTAQDVIDKVNCQYGFLFYVPDSKDKFYCDKKMFSEGRTVALSPQPERTISKCLSCQTGEEVFKQRQREKMLEKSMIKKILNFRKMLIGVMGDGFVSDVYFCMGYMRESMAIVFSRDNLTLTCPLIEDTEDAIVNIHKVCMNTVNPKTKTPPCKYLITDSHISRIKKKDFEGMEAEYEEVIETLPQLEEKKTIEVELEKVNDI